MEKHLMTFMWTVFYCYKIVANIDNFIHNLIWQISLNIDESVKLFLDRKRLCKLLVSLQKYLNNLFILKLLADV